MMPTNYWKLDFQTLYATGACLTGCVNVVELQVFYRIVIGKQFQGPQAFSSVRLRR